jgi:hypothetical protein
MKEIDRAADLTMKLLLSLRYNKVKLTKETRKLAADISLLLILVRIAEKIQARTLNIMEDYKAFRITLSILLHDEILKEIEKKRLLSRKG